MNAVIFDMDGVIVDSERYWQRIEERHILAEAVEAGALSASEITGMSVGDVYDYLDDRFETRVTREEFADLYDEGATELYTERVTLMDGFDRVLDSIRARGLKLALASSSPHRWIEMVTERFDLADAFDVVVSAEDIDAESKPAPDIYRHTADLLGVAPDRCIAVEDSTHGVSAAKEAGMYCIGYRGAGGGQDLSRADVIVENAAELRRQIERRSS